MIRLALVAVSAAVAHAALRGDLGPVQALLKAGADPSAPSTPGALPLALAAQNGHAEVVAALLEVGADQVERWVRRCGDRLMSG